MDFKTKMEEIDNESTINDVDLPNELPATEKRINDVKPWTGAMDMSWTGAMELDIR